MGVAPLSSQDDGGMIDEYINREKRDDQKQKIKYRNK